MYMLCMYARDHRGEGLFRIGYLKIKILKSGKWCAYAFMTLK